jgi:hypothetical protein
VTLNQKTFCSNRKNTNLNYEFLGKTTQTLKLLTSEVHVLMVFSFSNTYNRDTIAVQRSFWGFHMMLQSICGLLDASVLNYFLVYLYFQATRSMINWRESSKYWGQYHNSWFKGAKTEISTSISILKLGNSNSNLLMNFNSPQASDSNYQENT